MARYNPHHAVEPIYEAAASWRERCLERDGSILSDDLRLWTAALLDELNQRFVQNLDEGEGDFFEKLQSQLAAGPLNVVS